MAQLKPTCDTGGIAAIESGEQTPTINLKAHQPREALPYPAAAAGAGRTTPTPAMLRARLPGASCLPCGPHPSMIDSH